MAEKGYTLSENSSLALDLLRALASQAVVVGHGISMFASPDYPYVQNLAVVVFFVLSGFLITYATLRKPSTYTFMEFLIDRFARIYSAYLVALVLVVLIDRYAIRLDPAYPYASALNWRTFVGNVFMLQDFPRGEVHGLLLIGQHDPSWRVITSLGSARPFWTLAVEWWMYMGFGWIVLRRWRSPLYFAVLACLLVVPVYNVLGGRGNGLALMWIFGSAACVLASARRIAEARTPTLILAALGFAALSTQLLRITLEPYDVRYATLFAAAMLCTVLALDRATWRLPAFIVSAIRFIANYSFTLYLLHYTILAVMAQHPILESPAANVALGFGVSNIASIIVAYFTEFRHRALAAWLKTKLLSRP